MVAIVAGILSCFCRNFSRFQRMSFFPVASALVNELEEEICRNRGSSKSKTYNPVVSENAGSIDYNWETQIDTVNFIPKRNLERQLQIRIF